MVLVLPYVQFNRCIVYLFPLLAKEIGTVHKKWANRLPVALIYPNTYSVAVSNLGLQIVYNLLNAYEGIVCERFVYPDTGSSFRSLESGRALCDFPVICGSISFEEDYTRLAAMLPAGRVEPFAEKRAAFIAPGSPLVILGGVAVFMNPEPLAPFADVMVIGEAEGILASLLTVVEQCAGADRKDVLQQIARQCQGCYVPSLYTVAYDDLGKVEQVTAPPGIPARIKKVIAPPQERAGHSQLLSPEAELNMYMVELGRGCSRGCRFCAAGYIYRPPRLWNSEAILKAFAERPASVDRVGMLGMEMAHSETLDTIAQYLHTNNCSLSFSSLRADHISDKLLSLLAASHLKSVAIAPDGASERLRRLINKGLSEEDLLSAAIRLAEVGIFHLKLYLMIGLPTETNQDLEEFVNLVKKVQQALLPIGRKRGRLTEISLSVNSFVPKPWTPFQYCSFGGIDTGQATGEQSTAQSVMALKQKIKYLRKALTKVPNFRIKVDRPERVLQQAVYARADRRIAPLLIDVGMGRLTFKQALKQYDLSSWQYAVRPREGDERMCWEVVDHGLKPGYLWKEYAKSMAGQFTPPCETTLCRRCGICGENPPS